MKAVASALSVLLALIAGCGSDRPPPTSDAIYTPPPTGGGGGFADAGSHKPPGCGQKSDGSFCDCIDIPLFTDPPNMYFVLDRSGSMAEGNKWGQVRTTVIEIFRGLGPRANFGATLFPGYAQSQCAGPIEILPISPGDPVGADDGPTTLKMLSQTQTPPSGGTPTAAALRAVFQTLSSAKGKTFVILATDGAPNCNNASPCTLAQCMPNIENFPGCPPTGPSCCEPPDGTPESCLDSSATTSAVAALKAAGIPVYVIGLPGTATYASLLDSLAVSGGTALPTSPKYYRVDSTDSAPLLATLKKISAKIVATCEFKLTKAPTDPNLVNVYLDEVVLPQEAVNGWKIDGPTVTLLGSACQKVLAGDVLGVRIITGCPTVGPR